MGEAVREDQVDDLIYKLYTQTISLYCKHCTLTVSAQQAIQQNDCDIQTPAPFAGPILKLIMITSVCLLICGEAPSFQYD